MVSKTLRETFKKVGMIQNFLFFGERYNSKSWDSKIEVVEKGGCCILLILTTRKKLLLHVFLHIITP